MALDLSTLTDYSWSDIKKAAKTAMVSSALGGSRLVVNGNDITRISIDDAKKLYQLADEMIAIEGGDANVDGRALIQFDDAV
jgi:hypothetical protein